jgi:hypothetical protein
MADTTGSLHSTDGPEDSQSVYASNSLAAIQRQRTLRLYQTLFRKPYRVTVHLVSGQTLTADRLIAVDSSESKFVFQGLETQWGKSSRPVTIRGGDIARIQVALGQAQRPIREKEHAT